MKSFQVGVPRFLDFSSQMESLPYAWTLTGRVSGSLLHGAQQAANTLIFQNLTIRAGFLGDDLINGMHAQHFDRRFVVCENGRR